MDFSGQFKKVYLALLSMLHVSQASMPMIPNRMSRKLIYNIFMENQIRQLVQQLPATLQVLQDMLDDFEGDIRFTEKDYTNEIASMHLLTYLATWDIHNARFLYHRHKVDSFALIYPPETPSGKGSESIDSRPARVDLLKVTPPLAAQLKAPGGQQPFAGKVH